MRKKVLIIDTNILCVWLKVKDMYPIGQDNQITPEAVEAYINQAVSDGSTLILPLAVIIETGNHIEHSSGDVYQKAQELVEMIKKAVNEETPWAAFTQQRELWQGEGLLNLTQRWMENVSSGQSFGDASIVDVANYYFSMDYEVEIYTDDDGLKSYEPKRLQQQTPRRRR